MIDGRDDAPTPRPARPEPGPRAADRPFGWIGPRSERIARDAVRLRDEIILREDPDYLPLFVTLAELDVRRPAAAPRVVPSPIAAPSTVGPASAPARHVFWEATDRVFGGGGVPDRQALGDAVGYSIAVALADLIADECDRAGDARAAWRPYVPWLSGIGRVYLGGGRLRGDGSLTTWTVEAAHRYGVLADDVDGLPDYSPLVARRWQSSRRTLEAWRDLATPGVLGPVVRLTSWDDLVEAVLGRRMPATLASLQGFERIDVDRAVGKTFARPGGTWPHQQAIRGVDADPRRPGAFLMNGWGPIHDQLDGPAGGVWVDAETLDELLRREDTFMVAYTLAERADVCRAGTASCGGAVSAPSDAG